MAIQISSTDVPFLATIAKNFRELTIAYSHLDVVRLDCCRLSTCGHTVASYSVCGWEDGHRGKLLVRASISTEPSLLTNSVVFTITVSNGEWYHR